MKAHFIGIGGAGVSAAAKHLAQLGYSISGSDDNYSEIVKDLEKNFELDYRGVQNAENITEDLNMVIYTPAVGPGNSEYERARILDIDLLSYPEYLGRIAKDKKTIAIAGTNGKTTTTTMVAEALVSQEFDPTVIVGATSVALRSNYRSGNSDLFVVEACEYKNSFLSLTPDVLVITNITPDHLDFFKTIEEYTKAFMNLVGQMNGGSTLIYNGSDELTREVALLAESRGIHLVNYELQPELSLSLPGAHNIMNAQAAMAVVEALGGDVTAAQGYLEHELKGAERRLEKKGITQNGDIIIDDYAHNPEGLTLLLDGLERAYPERVITLFFQPHLYSRTRDLLHDFAKSLAVAQELVLLPIYAAREEHSEDISSEILGETISLIDETLQPTNLRDFDEAIEYYGEMKGDNKKRVIVTAGAGDIYKVGEAILEKYRN